MAPAKSLDSWNFSSEFSYLGTFSNKISNLAKWTQLISGIFPFKVSAFCYTSTSGAFPFRFLCRKEPFKCL